MVKGSVDMSARVPVSHPIASLLGGGGGLSPLADDQIMAVPHTAPGGGFCQGCH